MYLSLNITCTLDLAIRLLYVPEVYILHISRVIKFLYAPAPLHPTVWDLKPPSWALHTLCLSLANKCVCTRIMLVCTCRPLQGGLLYIKPPMHV